MSYFLQRWKEKFEEWIVVDSSTVNSREQYLKIFEHMGFTGRYRIVETNFLTVVAVYYLEKGRINAQETP